ncbi:hypothetical protein WMF30_02910 [Sorangium sp. So ce134]
MLVAALAACATEPLDGGAEAMLTSDARPLVTENALVPNALVPNALVPNALVPNALVPNALVPNALSPASLAAIQDAGERGALSRMFLRYVVGCALDSSQSFSFSWVDSAGVTHNETYAGILGIASTWATQPLADNVKQRLVSGCVAGRVNYSGTNVVISMRSLESPLKTLVGSSELAAYPHAEGAFWGNLFISSPYMNACYDAGNEAIARAASRYCATGYIDGSGRVLPCGPIVLQGSCSAWCKELNGAGQFHSDCVDRPGQSNTTTKGVITTALP